MWPRQKCNAALHFLIMSNYCDSLSQYFCIIATSYWEFVVFIVCCHFVSLYYLPWEGQLVLLQAAWQSSWLLKSGWQVFVHHLDMVVLSFPGCSSSHLSVFFFSARTTFGLFNSLFAIFRCEFKYKDNYNTSQSRMNTEEFMSVYQLGEVCSLLTVWI